MTCIHYATISSLDRWSWCRRVTSRREHDEPVPLLCLFTAKVTTHHLLPAVMRLFIYTHKLTDIPPLNYHHLIIFIHIYIYTLINDIIIIFCDGGGMWKFCRAWHSAHTNYRLYISFLSSVIFNFTIKFCLFILL